MTKTRKNHYVPQWYQEGFFEPGRTTYAYLDLTPKQHTLPDGRLVPGKSKFDAPTARAFWQRDLYSTFFGTSVNDEIERKLFGDIDGRGALAVRAFIGGDKGEWQKHFKSFFEYLDIQKIRTPKGLDWLAAQYPRLSQNDLMFEMQGIRMIHTSMWTEGVREIVSAEDSAVKFIVTDHPVTIYNHAVPPGAAGAVYPHDPSIALKASQTIFPLNRDFCLILTNLEYAQNRSASPLEKRTFAGNFRSSMVRTDAFIRARKLSSAEVIQINRILKARARRYVAAGKEEWLYPETSATGSWADLRGVLLPPDNGLWHFGGEMYASFENGDVIYQDAFGRTEKERGFLKKEPPAHPRGGDPCPCGSGRRFKTCCEPKAAQLRPSWTERSIRERNLMLMNGITKILGISDERDWLTIRREITDEKIRDVYGLYDALWPRDTNLLALLPKSDGRARALYTGVLHPSTVANYALGASLYFDETLIQDPFTHPRTVKKEFSPLDNPASYRQEFVKSVVFFTAVVPLVELGIVNLFPDPANFDLHLRDQAYQMAQARSRKVDISVEDEPGILELMKEDSKRAMLAMPREAWASMVRRQSPELDDTGVEDALSGFQLLRETDPLATLQDGATAPGEEGGQLLPMKMAPNFEISMYLAQATGSCIVTDSIFRWRELMQAASRTDAEASPLAALKQSIEQTEFAFAHDVRKIAALSENGVFLDYPPLMRKVMRYLIGRPAKDAKPNVEAALKAEFSKFHPSVVAFAKKLDPSISMEKLAVLWPLGGIQDNTVNRLLLMSSSEHHLASVPMALFLGSNRTSAAATRLTI